MKLFLWLVGWTVLVIVLPLPLWCRFRVAFNAEQAGEVDNAIGPICHFVWFAGGIALFLFLDWKA
jgi:hypothetical protein